MPKSIIWFYVLVAYVAVQFTWWAFHLISLSNEVYSSDKAASRIWMILGEGAVFLSLLGIGIWQLKKSIKKEMSLNRDQRNFLLSTTHELKTPIAALNLMLETLEKRELDREKQKELLRKALGENDRLNKLIDNVLLAARIESNKTHLVLEEGNMADSLNAAVSRLGFKYNKERIKLKSEEIKCEFDSVAIESVFTNIIENALKYSDDDIEVSLSQSGNVILFSCKDSGNGIENVDKAIQLFYREENEDTRSTQGSGLGLFIVDQLVKLHGGSMIIKSKPNKGTTVEIRLAK